jgi:excisionase family DNA binding protein
MSRATQRAILLSNAERNQVEALERVLEAGVPVLVSPAGERVELPVSVFEVLKEAVGFMSHGRGITVFPDDQVVTTQQAADVLGMSRPFLVKLLEHGAIAFHRVGNQRRPGAAGRAGPAGAGCV